MTDSEKALLPDALYGACFHGEVWVRCPHCKDGIEMMGMLGKEVDTYKSYRIYQCSNCKGYFKDR